MDPVTTVRRSAGPLASVLSGPVAARPTAVSRAAHTLLPGLVDVHNHGGGGAGFPDASTLDEARVAIREHLAHGTTTLVASLVTAAPATLHQRVSVLTALAEAGEPAGIHLEGPFLSSTRCGAQDPELIQAPDADLVRELAEAAHGYMVTMTVAPELAGVVGDGDVIDALITARALPSFGHAGLLRTAPHNPRRQSEVDRGDGLAGVEGAATIT